MNLRNAVFSFSASVCYKGLEYMQREIIYKTVAAVRKSTIAFIQHSHAGEEEPMRHRYSINGNFLGSIISRTSMFRKNIYYHFNKKMFNNRMFTSD